MFNLGQFVTYFSNATGKGRKNKEILQSLFDIIAISIPLTDITVTRIIKSEIDLSADLGKAIVNQNSLVTDIRKIIESEIPVNNRQLFLGSIIFNLLNDSTILDSDMIDLIGNTTRYDLKHKTKYSIYTFIAGVYLYIVKRPTKIQDNVATPITNDNINEILSKITIEENMIDDISVPSTLSTTSFMGVFKQFYHRQYLETRKASSVDFYYLDFDSTDYESFNYSKLKKQIYLNIQNFAFSRPELKNLIDEGMQAAIIHQAIRKLEKTNQIYLEDILLYIMLEYFLKAPKLLTSVEMVNYQGTYTPNSSSIHILNKKFATEDMHQLIFGVSCISNNLSSMIDELFNKISNILRNNNERNQFINNSIINSTFEETEAEFIINIYKNGINNSSSKGFGIFIGYKLDITKNYTSKNEFDRLFQNQLQKDIELMTRRINQKITELNIKNYPIYIYIVPFNNADLDKQQIMDDILGGDIE